MGKIRSVGIGAIAALTSVVAISAAQADSVLVTVWGGHDDMAALTGFSPDSAQDPNPATTASATFVYTSSSPVINWVNNDPNNGTDPTQNLFSQFFNFGDVSAFTSPDGAYTLTSFENASISSMGNSWFSYVRVDGTVLTPATGSISHDDGASVYSASCPDGVCYNSPSQTTDIMGSFSIGAGPAHIDYIEANGSPSDLVVTGITFRSTSTVPESSTWAMMLLGFAGLGFAGYRASRRPAAA
jgi:hypothetical protein